MSGVRLVHTASQADSVEALMALHSYFGNQHRQEVRDRVPLSHLREDLGMLAAIKGVGVERAQALLEHFGSVERVVNATVKELTEVSGVGQKTAEHIRQIIEGRR
jgi:Fanconi anemia group M protein